MSLLVQGHVMPEVAVLMQGDVIWGVFILVEDHEMAEFLSLQWNHLLAFAC